MINLWAAPLAWGYITLNMFATSFRSLKKWWVPAERRLNPQRGETSMCLVLAGDDYQVAIDTFKFSYWDVEVFTVSKFSRPQRCWQKLGGTNWIQLNPIHKFQSAIEAAHRKGFPTVFISWDLRISGFPWSCKLQALFTPCFRELLSASSIHCKKLGLRPLQKRGVLHGKACCILCILCMSFKDQCCQQALW